MDRSSSMEKREHEYKEILLLGFITCKILKYKYFQRRVLCYNPNGGISEVKHICNKENVNVIGFILIKGSHVQCMGKCIYRSQY